MAYENILVETKGSVGIITLDRPEALNALNAALIEDLGQALDSFEADDNIGCIVLTGSSKAFAAGADISEMAPKSYMDVYREDFITAGWERVSQTRKPVIAAVAGFALGGGCEMAMMCDFIIAADNAKFGQPEINLGILPGAGGTQRLTRAVGKFKAMRMILTGEIISGREADAMGLASAVVADDAVEEHALDMASRIASMPPLAVTQAKEVLLAGQDASLEAGLMLERKAFQILFDSLDQKEGMKAFLEKRKPTYQGR